MRTTMNLSDAVMSHAKQHARDSGRTLTSVVEQALVELLERAGGTGSGAPAEPFLLPTYGAPGGVVHVNLSDNEAVRDVMDECA